MSTFDRQSPEEVRERANAVHAIGAALGVDTHALTNRPQFWEAMAAIHAYEDGIIQRAEAARPIVRKPKRNRTLRELVRDLDETVRELGVHASWDGESDRMGQ